MPQVVAGSNADERLCADRRWCAANPRIRATAIRSWLRGAGNGRLQPCRRDAPSSGRPARGTDAPPADGRRPGPRAKPRHRRWLPAAVAAPARRTTRVGRDEWRGCAQALQTASRTPGTVESRVGGRAMLAWTTWTGRLRRRPVQNRSAPEDWLESRRSDARRAELLSLPPRRRARTRLSGRSTPRRELAPRRVSPDAYRTNSMKVERRFTLAPKSEKSARVGSAALTDPVPVMTRVKRAPGTVSCVEPKNDAVGSRNVSRS